MRLAIRSIALIILALCLAAAVFALLPGTRRLHDANRCFERGNVSLFGTSHGKSPPRCVAQYVDDGTERAGSGAVALMLAVTAVAAILVAWRPRPLHAVLWSAMTFVVRVLLFIAFFDLDFDFDFDLFSDTYAVVLWPQRALGTSISAMYVLLLVLLVTGIVGLRRESRNAEPAPLPRAVVVPERD